MKDHISNYSSPLSTLSKRLLVTTGKGGTGKTSIALALAYHLHNKNKKVLFYQSQVDQGINTAKELGIPTLELDLYDSTEEYIARKLGQKTIAHWIMKAPFFKSMLDILPSLGDMILLGHLIDILEKDPEITLVMDAPSTGHTLSFFESPFNFKKIFKTGLLANDVDRMINFLTKKETLHFFIIALPSSMAVQESEELKYQLTELGFENNEIIINNLLAANSVLMEHHHDLPEFFHKKIELENKAITKLENNLLIPFIFGRSNSELVKTVSSMLNTEGDQ